MGNKPIVSRLAIPAEGLLIEEPRFAAQITNRTTEICCQRPHSR
jgi:hypothetical protein